MFKVHLPDQVIELEYRRLDLNADGIDELFIFGTYSFEGLLLGIVCREGRFISRQFELYSRPRSLHVNEIRDINGDGIQDILFLNQYSGQGWCYQGYLIVSISDIGRMTILMQTNPLVACFADNQFEFIWEEQAATEIRISGSPIVHISAGPSRQTTFVYRMTQSGSYLLAEEVRAEPEYRIHVLEDAQEALDAGRIATAIEHYVVAFEYPDLDAWVLRNTYRGDSQLANEYQQAFAGFRLAVLYGAEDSLASADAVIADMADRATPAFTVFTELGTEFLTALAGGSDPQAACDRVYETIQSDFADLETYFYGLGWDMTWYRNTDFCPYR